MVKVLDFQINPESIRKKPEGKIGKLPCSPVILVPELVKLTVSEPPPKLWLFADPQTETTQRSVDACHYKKTTPV